MNNWKTKSNPLIYKIKFKDINNILIDLTISGFSKNLFFINYLPVGSDLILEVIDNQGFSTTIYCNKINVLKNLIICVSKINIFI